MNRLTPRWSRRSRALASVALIAACLIPHREAGAEAINGTWSQLIDHGPLDASATVGNWLGVYDAQQDQYVVAGPTGVHTLSLAGGMEWVHLSVSRVDQMTNPRGAYLPATNEVFICGGPLGTPVTVAKFKLNAVSPTWQTLATTNPKPLSFAFSTSALAVQSNQFYVLGASISSDIWQLDLNTSPATWTKLTPTGTTPVLANGCTMVHDPTRNRLVLWDGYNGGLWALDLASLVWSQLDSGLSPSPAPRGFSSSIYHSSLDRFVLYGGNVTSARLNETWAFDFATGWRHLLPEGALPPVSDLQLTAYDPVRDLMVVQGSNGGESPGVHTLTWGASSSPPRLDGFSPAGGPPGTEVVLAGNLFLGATRVRFNGTEATFEVLGVSQIRTMVPPGATSGPIEVENQKGIDTSATAFVVAYPPQLTGVEPDSARPGERVLLKGSHLSGVTSILLPNAKNAILEAVTDSSIKLVIVGLPANGPLAVTSAPLAAVTTAFMFRVLPPRTDPVLISVRDLPNDQGGKVILRWLGSQIEPPSSAFYSITLYRIWRRAPLDAAALASLNQSATMMKSNGSYWELIGELPVGSPGDYAFTAPTFQDSIAGSTGRVAFLIQATNESPAGGPFFNSLPDSGYSVDNLAPPAPLPFAANYSAGSVALHWAPSRAPDFREFKLHRSPLPGFVPDASNLVIATRDTGHVDQPGGAFYYKLIAVDVHGNASRVASVSPNNPVAALASAREATWDGRNVRLVWSTSAAPAQVIRIQRRTEQTVWQDLATRTVDGSGDLSWVDESVEPGQRYGYRLAWSQEGAPVASGEVWVDVTAPRMTIGGAYPNPATRATGFSLHFSLASDAPATIEVYDLAGRRVASESLRSPRSGAQAMRIQASDGLAPGLYLVQLSQGAKKLTTRAAMIQ